MTLKPCTKTEFDAFIAAYPRKLERNVFMAGDPPLVTYNDFSDGKVWPDSVVASHFVPDNRDPDQGWRIKW
jgi:hypothetical protein